TPPVRLLGERLVGRVARSERAISFAGPLTLVHGDASLVNMRTGPDGQVALLDWEDVSAAPGVVDLAWVLVSSGAPARWDEASAAYGPAAGLLRVLPAVVVQGLLSLSGTSAGSAAAATWIRRLDMAANRLSAVELYRRRAPWFWEIAGHPNLCSLRVRHSIARLCAYVPPMPVKTSPQ